MNTVRNSGLATSLAVRGGRQSITNPVILDLAASASGSYLLNR